MTRLLKWLVLVNWLMIPALQAAELNMNGFASVGGGVFSEDLFKEHNRPYYRGVNDDFTADSYNKFGLKLSSSLNETTDITAQFLTRGSEDYDLQAEWMYLTYNFSSSNYARVGRLRAPFYYFSDYLDVGYAYPWIAPPEMVYGRLRIPVTTVEGIDFVNQHDIGDNWSGAFQIYYGLSTEKFEFNSDTAWEEVLDIRVDQLTGFNYVLSRDWFSARLSYNTADITGGTPARFQQLFDSISATAAAVANTPLAFNGQEVIDTMNLDEVQAKFSSVAFNIDHTRWLATAEYTLLNFDRDGPAVATESKAWYLMLGYRFGDFTLHTTYVEREDTPEYNAANLIPDHASLSTLKTTMKGLVENNEQTSTILGLRYDYSSSTAFKLEWEALDVDDRGPLNNDYNGNLFSFSVDVVF